VGPAPAVAEVRRAVRVALGRRPIVVACSGGADSLALAAAVAFEAPRAGVRAGLVTVDHALQPGSAQQAARVAALAYNLGFDPVEILPVRVGTEGGPEAAARTARYRALDDTAEALGADVLLGHTLDDQAETVLLGLGRGSGPRSIVGMRQRSGCYLRPLLGVRRATTAAACAALGLEPWRDPHNDDPSYQRVRLRREVLPLLESVLQGGVAQALARTAELLRADLDYLDERAAGELAALHRDHAIPADSEPGELARSELDAAAVAALPPPLRTRVLRRWAEDGGAGHLTAHHVDALDALVVRWRGQGPVDLPGGVRARRVSARLALDPSAPPGPAVEE
jgi:tRNA(Ile)-lysidine synthase